jgi:hypothetical protein
MTAKRQTPMTEEAARALADKFGAWVATLEADEQAALGEAFREAGAAGSDDVDGYCKYCRGVIHVFVTVLGAAESLSTNTGGSALANDGGPKY